MTGETKFCRKSNWPGRKGEYTKLNILLWNSWWCKRARELNLLHMRGKIIFWNIILCFFPYYFLLLKPITHSDNGKGIPNRCWQNIICRSDWDFMPQPPHSLLLPSSPSRQLLTNDWWHERISIPTPLSLPWGGKLWGVTSIVSRDRVWNRATDTLLQDLA